MISQTIARRYAQALLALGREDGNYETYGREVSDFAQALETSDLAEALVNPIYPADSRRAVLDAVLAKMGPSKIVQNFLGLLQDKGRIGHARAIADYYQRLVDEVNNVKRATITTATPVGDDVKDQVLKALEKMTGTKVVLSAEQDEDIIGGIIAKVGDLTLDGSVRTQLRNLKESLIKG